MLGRIFKPRQLVEGMIPFGNTVGGDILVWDQSRPERSCSRGVEYEIFLLMHGTQNAAKAASSFSEFVYDVCLSRGFGKLVGDKKWVPLLEFMPYGPIPRSRS